MQFAQHFWLNFLLFIPVFILGKLIISREISPKYICLCLSFTAIIFAMAGPYYETKIPTRRFLFIFDISRSSTVADMRNSQGKPVSRLEFAKDMFAKTIPLLPKGTSVGIGATLTGYYAFDQNANIKIFWPVTALNEKNSGAFYKALGITDWWNAWGEKSEWPWFFTSLAWVLDNQLEKDMNVVIITDGGSDLENLPAYDKIISSAKFEIDRTRARLTFLGVGGEVPREVPDFDENLKPTGLCFKKRDGNCFMSRLEEKNLKRVAVQSGGKYIRFRGHEDLISVVSDSSARISGIEIVKENADKKFMLSALLFLILFLVL